MIFIFPFSWEFHNPNWQTHIFQRSWNHQPEIDVFFFPQEHLNRKDIHGFSRETKPQDEGIQDENRTPIKSKNDATSDKNLTF